jgi:arylsulfatase A-like enzyme
MLMTDDQTTETMRFLPRVRRLIGGAGVTFSNSIVTTPLCCPSRSTYLTGQYAHNHGVHINYGVHGGFGALAHRDTTFPVALQRAGYFTAHIGKYLNGFSIHDAIPPGWSDFWATYGARTYNYYGLQIDHMGQVRSYDTAEKNYSTDLFARLADGVIERRSGKGPFFLNVSFLAPHSAGLLDRTMPREPHPTLGDPHEIDYRLAVPPRRYRGRLASLALPRPASLGRIARGAPSYEQEDPFFRPLTHADLADITARYRARAGSLMAVDDAVASIVATLRRTGQLGHTVIIFTSDNGFFNGEHRIRAGKFYVYEPGIRVPLLMRGPGIPQGAVRSTLAANIDLAPTILDIAGVQPLRPPDGISLLPAAQGRPSPSRALLLETWAQSVYPVSYRGVRTSRYKYVRYSTGDETLFDLQKDPDELRNLATDPSAASTLQRLRRDLAQLRRCAADTCTVGDSAGS